jgi:hypothetical protein
MTENDKRTEGRKKEDPLRTKSMAFAVRIYRLSKRLREYFLDKAELTSYLADCLELRRLLSATCQTLEKGLSNP